MTNSEYFLSNVEAKQMNKQAKKKDGLEIEA
jgi:hypothetical protein